MSLSCVGGPVLAVSLCVRVVNSEITRSPRPCLHTLLLTFNLPLHISPPPPNRQPCRNSWASHFPSLRASCLTLSLLTSLAARCTVLPDSFVFPKTSPHLLRSRHARAPHGGKIPAIFVHSRVSLLFHNTSWTLDQFVVRPLTFPPSSSLTCWPMRINNLLNTDRVPYLNRTNTLASTLVPSLTEPLPKASTLMPVFSSPWSQNVPAMALHQSSFGTFKARHWTPARRILVLVHQHRCRGCVHHHHSPRVASGC